MPRFGKYRIVAVMAAVLGASLAVYAAIPTAHAAAAPSGGQIAQLQAQIDALQQQVDQQQVQLDQQAQLVATKQDAVTGTCAQGQHISHINADGSIVCTGDTVHVTYLFGARHLNPFEAGDIQLQCPAGTAAVGGGFQQSNVGISTNWSLISNWTVSGATNLLGGDFSAAAICVPNA